MEYAPPSSHHNSSLGRHVMFSNFIKNYTNKEAFISIKTYLSQVGICWYNQWHGIKKWQQGLTMNSTLRILSFTEIDELVPTVIEFSHGTGGQETQGIGKNVPRKK
jgi:hypothetical protein